MGDPYWLNVVLLSGFEGADGSTIVTDESPAAHGTATMLGNAQIDTAQFKFGTSSLLSDGSGDGINFPDHVDWFLSPSNSSPFTIECFVRTTVTNPTNRGLVWQGVSSGSLSFAFWVETTGNGQLAFWGSTNLTSFNVTVAATGMTWSTSQWYHLAVDKDATGKIRLYRDGVMVASSTPASSAFTDSTASLRIGTDGANIRSWPGWIDEIRISKGVARYASDSGFIVPTSAFPRSGGSSERFSAGFV